MIDAILVPKTGTSIKCFKNYLFFCQLKNTPVKGGLQTFIEEIILCVSPYVSNKLRFDKKLFMTNTLGHHWEPCPTTDIFPILVNIGCRPASCEVK